MPAWRYHVKNSVSGLDFKGYVYAETKESANAKARAQRRVFGKSTKLISVERIKVTMPKATVPRLLNGKAEVKRAKQQTKKHQRRKR